MAEESEYFIVGKILKPFGLKGEVKVLPITDDPARYGDLEFVFLKKGDSYMRVGVEGAFLHGGYVRLKLEGCRTREDGDKLRNRVLYIDRPNAAALEEGSYYYYDLLGCRVRTGDGEELGTVEDIRNSGSCDVYVVRSVSGEEYLIPAIRDVIHEIDVQEKKIIINVIDGLL